MRNDKASIGAANSSAVANDDASKDIAEGIDGVNSSAVKPGKVVDAIANSVMKTNIGHDKVALINTVSNSLINQFSAIPDTTVTPAIIAKENASSDDVSTKMHCKPMVDFGKNS